MKRDPLLENVLRVGVSAKTDVSLIKPGKNLDGFGIDSKTTQILLGMTGVPGSSIFAVGGTGTVVTATR